MTLTHPQGDTLELPPPLNGIGDSVLIFNGKIVEHVFYGFGGDGKARITLASTGEQFNARDFAKWVAEKYMPTIPPEAPADPKEGA